MDDELIPAPLDHLLWARREESPRPTGSGRLRGHALPHHETPGALHTAGEDAPAMGTESRKESDEGSVCMSSVLLCLTADSKQASYNSVVGTCCYQKQVSWLGFSPLQQLVCDRRRQQLLQGRLQCPVCSDQHQAQLLNARGENTTCDFLLVFVTHKCLSQNNVRRKSKERIRDLPVQTESWLFVSVLPNPSQ